MLPILAEAIGPFDCHPTQIFVQQSVLGGVELRLAVLLLVLNMNL